MLIMDCDKDSIDEFLPKKTTIGRRRRPSSKKNVQKEDESKKSKAQLKITLANHMFEDTDPFANPKEFVSFYRSIIRSYAEGNVKFPNHGADRQYAALVMDELIDIGREKDLEFLRSWIKYYGEFKLKDDDFQDYNKTSIRWFSQTIEEYKKKHIDV